MSRKSTHSGTCQVCGSEQALPGDVLAKHGYTVEHGWFEGVCPGAGHLPLELSRELADEVAADLARQADGLLVDLAEIHAGRLLPKFADGDFYTRDRNGNRVRVDVLFADADSFEQERAVHALRWNTSQREREARHIAESITNRACKITGKRPLTPRVEERRKVVKAGSLIQLWGKRYRVLDVAIVEARGQGPHLNGQHIPHAGFLNAEGKTHWYPVRKIRQSSIIEE